MGGNGRDRGYRSVNEDDHDVRQGHTRRKRSIVVRNGMSVETYRGRPGGNLSFPFGNGTEDARHVDVVHEDIALERTSQHGLRRAFIGCSKDHRESLQHFRLKEKRPAMLSFAAHGRVFACRQEQTGGYRSIFFADDEEFGTVGDIDAVGC